MRIWNSESAQRERERESVCLCCVANTSNGSEKKTQGWVSHPLNIFLHFLILSRAFALSHIHIFLTFLLFSQPFQHLPTSSFLFPFKWVIFDSHQYSLIYLPKFEAFYNFLPCSYFLSKIFAFSNYFLLSFLSHLHFLISFFLWFSFAGYTHGWGPWTYAWVWILWSVG